MDDSLPMRDGEVMGAYIDFDRKADKTWTPAEYLIKFGAYISERTVERNKPKTFDMPVAPPIDMGDLDGWRRWLGPRPQVAMNTFVNGNNVTHPIPNQVNLKWLAHGLLNHIEGLNVFDRRAAVAAVDTLRSLKYEWKGGERWQPPLRFTPPRTTLDEETIVRDAIRAINKDMITPELRHADAIQNFAFRRETLMIFVRLLATHNPKQPVDARINKRNAEALLEQLMSECEQIGYEKAMAEVKGQGSTS